MKMRMYSIVCTCVLGFPPTQEASAYQLVDLGTLGGTYSVGTGINANGQITGYSATAGNSDSHAFLYDGTTLQDLGTLGGSRSYGQGINDKGQVAGFSNFDTSSTSANHGFLYEGATMQDIGFLEGGYALGGYSRAYGINASGLVTGDSYINNSNHAFIYDGTTMQDLGVLNQAHPGSAGHGINDSGQVTGISSISGYHSHAFLYSGGAMQDLGTLGGYDSSGEGINNSGQVTGWSDTVGDGSPHAFLYDDGTMHDLGTLGGPLSYGYGINANGQVVGRSQLSNGQQAAFFYDGSSTLDLCVVVNCTGAGWNSLLEARAINDRGDITGYGQINGELHAYLLSSVPVPAAMWLFVSGLLGVTWVGARQGK